MTGVVTRVIITRRSIVNTLSARLSSPPRPQITRHFFREGILIHRHRGSGILETIVFNGIDFSRKLGLADANFFRRSDGPMNTGDAFLLAKTMGQTLITGVFSFTTYASNPSGTGPFASSIKNRILNGNILY